MLPLLLSGLGTTVEGIRCQEIFDYSTYDQPDSVRYLVGMGQPMDYEPPMLAPSIPTMVWGGQVRLMARGLGVELDEIREVFDRRALDDTITTATMGDFEAGTQARCDSSCRASSADGPESSSNTSPASTRIARRTGRFHPTAVRAHTG